MCRSKAAGGRQCHRHSGGGDRQQAMTGPLIGAGSTLTLTRTLAQQLDPPTNLTAVPSLGTGRYADLRGDQRNAQIVQDLHTAVEQIAQSGRIEQWLDAMSTDGLRRWSANNRLIALLQLHERAKGRPEYSRTCT